MVCPRSRPDVSGSKWGFFSGTDAGGGTDAGSGTDSGGNTDSGGGGGCQTTGGLAAPAVQKAVIDATFSNPAMGYNGIATAFMGVEQYGYADNAGQARWGAFNKAAPPVDDALRQIEVAVPAMPTACQSFTTVASASVPPYVRYLEGGPQAPGGAKAWWCGGTVIVDTINGVAYTFHFDGECKPAAAGTTALGTVHISGKGAGTFR